MIQNDHTYSDYKVYCSSLFVKDMKHECGDHDSIPEDLDRYKEMICRDEVRNTRRCQSYGDQCRGFLVVKGRKFPCRQMKKNKACRIIYCIKEDCCFLIDIYTKDKEDITPKQKKQICDALASVKKNNCYDEFIFLGDKNFAYLI